MLWTEMVIEDIAALYQSYYQTFEDALKTIHVSKIHFHKTR